MPRKTKPAADPAESGPTVDDLDALARLASVQAPTPRRDVSLALIPLAEIQIGTNVRTEPGDVAELAASIRERGVIVPITVRAIADGYELETGQRRVTAALLAGLVEIPAVIVGTGPAPAEERAIDQLVENMQRVDLNPIQRAQAMRAIVDSGVTQKDLARRLGIAESTVSNDLRLLKLDDAVTTKIAAGEISASHGKALAALPAEKQRTIVDHLAYQIKTGKPISSHDLEQQIEWRENEVKGDEERRQKTAAIVPRALEALAGTPAGTPIILEVNGYTYDHQDIADALKKAGYPKADARRATWDEARPKGCDCSQIELVIRGKSAKIRTVCVNAEHAEAKAKAERKADQQAADDKRARYEAIRAWLADWSAGIFAGTETELLRTIVGLQRGAYYAKDVAAMDRDALVGHLVPRIIWDVDAVEYLNRLGIPDPVAARLLEDPAPRKRRGKATAAEPDVTPPADPDGDAAVAALAEWQDPAEAAEA